MNLHLLVMICFLKALTFLLASGSEAQDGSASDLAGPDVLHVVQLQMCQQRYSLQQPPEFHISGNKAATKMQMNDETARK